MSKLKVLLAAAATCAVCLGAAAGSKHALLVGVDKYLKINDLYGCATDVRNMTDMLVNCGGWPADSVHQLLNDEATVANVSSAFKDLAGRVQSGDTVVVFWSSHGAYTNNVVTGMDWSYLCAHDAAYTDKMLAKDLGRFTSGAKVVVVIDTCHSGALFQTATVGGNAKDASATFAQRVDALLSRSKAGGIAASEVGWMTAVAYNQLSGDMGPAIGGRYTGNCLVYDGVYWGKADTDKDGDISFLDLHKHALKWFSLEATLARHKALYGTAPEDKEEFEATVMQTSPQMLHEDVLASVLARDHAVAGGATYPPIKVEFHLFCDGKEILDGYESCISNNAVQFLWPGESAVEPLLHIVPKELAFEGWDTDFTDVRNDLIVRGMCVKVSEANIETFAEVAKKANGKFVGYAMAGCPEDPETSDVYFCLAAAFEGAYAKGGKLTVTLTGVDGTKDKFSGRLDDVSVDGFFLAELTSSKSDDMIAIKISASAVSGTYCHDGVEYPILGNWDWLSTRETLAQAIRERYAAVYNVDMNVDFSGGREELPKVGGYVNVVLSEQNGKAKVTGMLGDGTKISVTTKAVVLSTLEKALDDDKGVIYVPIVFARTNKRSGFSGLLALYLDSRGARFANFDYHKDGEGGTRAYWDNSAQDEATAFQAFLTGGGSEFLADKMPETAKTVMSGNVPPLYVKVGDQYVEFACETNVLPSAYALAYANGKFKVTDPQQNDAKLKLTMNKRTGVISGSFRVWYADDPADPSVEKYVTATVYGGWRSHYTGSTAFGLLPDTHPDRAKLKLKVPVDLVIMAAAASDEAGED